MKVKVCGMTQLDQVLQLEEMGVDFAGFIFYDKSPRHVFKNGLTGREIKKARLKIIKVGVFVNAPYNEIMKHRMNVLKLLIMYMSSRPLGFQRMTMLNGQLKIITRIQICFYLTQVFLPQNQKRSRVGYMEAQAGNLTGIV